ncbi:alpha/beta fold hydrolase [Paraburkholderia sp. ZP32-5]|uniref:alpha/beta fold hydrolase n=1 Tax=Paraburkholderia sp. ZP32-5 TaxID=2883245 RepID=UPI001F295189|nr:alpha/beta fold hydrolase [Paraburkholderia sp. ZP32-5]
MTFKFRWTHHASISLRYAIDGHGPRSMILLHELGGSLASWDAVIDPLASDFTLLRFDQRGHGASEKVRDAVSVEQLADDLETVIDAAALPGPYWLVSTAAGAVISLVYAARHPQRVAGLVMCAPALGADAERRRYLEQRSELAAAHGMRAIVDATLERSYPPVIRRREDPAIFAAYRSRFLANDPVSYGLANRALGDAQLLDTLAGCSAPCLMLAGTHDPLRPPAHVAEFAARWGSRAAIEFAELDCAHLASVQAPLPLASGIADFVRRCEAKRSGEHDVVSSAVSSST